MKDLPLELYLGIIEYIKPERYCFTEKYVSNTKKNIQSIGTLQTGCCCVDGIVCKLCKNACCIKAKSMYCKCSDHIYCYEHGSKCVY